MIKRKRHASESKEDGPLHPSEHAGDDKLSPLSAAEEKDLLRIESRIAAGLSAFFNVAYALMEIKRRRLYRAEFTSFEEYCRKRWDMHRAYAYRLIGAAEVCAKLSPMGDIPLPENERQIRPLTGLPEKAAEKAWKRAVEKAGATGRITGALVEKAVEEIVRSHPGLKMGPTKEHWQTRITKLLEEALKCAKKGDKEAVSDIIHRISLLLLVGKSKSENE